MRPATAVALALALTACATGNGGSVAADAKSAVMLKVADDTRAGGDPAGALAIYRDLHETAPNDPVPLIRIGATAMELADYADAVTAYRAALVIDPKDVDSHRGLALVLLAQGHPEEAINELKAALAANANDPRTYNALGVAHDMMGQYAEAQKDYRNGLKLAPTNANLRNNFGMSLALAGDFEGAIATLDGLGSVADAPARFRLNLALAYGLAGNDEKAALVARHVLDEQAVKNNLEYYAMLRAMDPKSRAAAIVSAQLHGSAIASAAVKSTDTASAVPPAAAPQVAVQATMLPVPAAPVPSESTADAASPPTKVAAGDATPAPPGIAHRHKHQKLVAKAAASAPPKPDEVPAGKDTPQTVPSTPAEAIAAVSELPPTDATIGSAAETATAAPEPASAPPVQMVASPKQEAAAPAEPTEAAIAEAKAPEAVPLSTLSTNVSVEQTVPGAVPVTEVAATNAAALVTEAASPPTPVSEAVAADTVGEHFVVQLGSYVLESSARKVADQCAAKGFDVHVGRGRGPNGRDWFFVRSSEFASAAEAKAAIQNFREVAGIAPRMMHHRGSTTAQADDAASEAAMPASAQPELHDGAGLSGSEAPGASFMSTLADGSMDGIAAAVFAPKLAAAEPVAEVFDPARTAFEVTGSVTVAISNLVPAAAAPPMTGGVHRGLVQRRPDNTHVVVQIGSYLHESSARKVMNECAAHDIEVKLGREHDRQGRAWFTLRTAEFASSDEAAPVLRQISQIHGVAPIFIKRRAPSA